MKTKINFIFSACIAPLATLLVAGVTDARADEIVITDCAGTVRATQSVTGSDAKRLHFTLANNISTNVEIVSPAGEKRDLTAVGGVVVLEKITAGQWKLCPQGDATIAKVAVLDAATSGENDMLAIGTGIVGGSAAIAGLALSGSSKDRNDQSNSDSELLSVTADGSSSSETSSNAGSSEQSRPTVNVDAEDCINDQVATPVSSFL